jgi:subtilase family serine protease
MSDHFAPFRKALAALFARHGGRGRQGPGKGLRLEELEGRLVPSTTLAGGTAAPQAHVVPNGAVAPFGGGAPGGGFSPAQVRHAYGFDQITFNNGTVTGDGTGQTIAVIDAMDQPNIASDLANFDAALGIAAPPSFTKVNQNGGTGYPAADQNWGLEISLDVEWAHAMAPGANILLVEANSSNFSDLFAAINYARNYAGVSAVTMSWGGGEWSSESGYDGYFTTPAGHGGVTFVASTGDNGSAGGIEYPSISPNVLAVGGTQLTLDSNDNWSSEAGWSGSGGGVSAYESQPGYQKGVVTQTSTKRAVPDVAYDGSSASPFGVYDTYGYSGWLQVYGTSAGAPQWAALIAIADQGRALAGQASLDGATQMLPKLYQLPAADFHDITSGSNGAYAAGPGYDLVTGLGTPLANLIAPALIDAAATGGKAPTVVAPASANPNPVTGTTANLSVQGAAANGTDPLTYTWSVSSGPSGAGPTFTVNGTGAAQNTTATFHQAGSYTFLVTIADTANGQNVTSTTSVTVNQTMTSVVVTPGSATLADGSTQQFTATAADQFGKSMAAQPAFSWSMNGVGTVSANGMYTAPATGTGSATVQATAGGSSLSSGAAVTVGSVPAAPSSFTAVAAGSNRVNLSWNESSSNVTGFVIQRSTNGNNWTQIAKVGASATTYTDTTVKKGRTYYYRIYAYNPVGNSGYSNTTGPVTPAAATVGKAGFAGLTDDTQYLIPTAAAPVQGVVNPGAGSWFEDAPQQPVVAITPTRAGRVESLIVALRTASHAMPATDDPLWML